MNGGIKVRIYLYYILQNTSIIEITDDHFIPCAWISGCRHEIDYRQIFYKDNNYQIVLFYPLHTQIFFRSIMLFSSDEFNLFSKLKHVHASGLQLPPSEYSLCTPYFSNNDYRKYSATIMFFSSEIKVSSIICQLVQYKSITKSDDFLYE